MRVIIAGLMAGCQSNDSIASTLKIPRLRSWWRAVALSVVATGMVGCGGTIYFGSSHSPRPTGTDATIPAAAVDPVNCRLPVVVMREAGPPYQFTSEPGFVNTGRGQYLKDGAASIAGLPADSPGNSIRGQSLPAEPDWYDGPAKRWLPTKLVAPDGYSYLWRRLLPQGSNSSSFEQAELHRYDLTTDSDQRLWIFPGAIHVDRWDGSGILVDTLPPTGGPPRLWWLIDPRTGVATRQPPSHAPRGLTGLPGDQQYGGYDVVGSDARGRAVYRMGGRASGDLEWVFYETAPGQRVTIYKGTQGDATDFDPSVALEDETGIWFSDNENQGVWHWDSRTGLWKIAVKGLPDLLPGPNSATYVDPAGPCI